MRGFKAGWTDFLKYLIPAIFTLVISEADAQITTSPYSRYGFGDLHRGTFGQNFALGNTGIGLRQSAFINVSNPASYSAFDLTVFEAGINSNFTEHTADTLRVTTNYASLGYLGFGIPVMPGWGLSFGLLPFSSTGYNIMSERTVEGVGGIASLFRGEGGLNRVFLGNGFKYKRFSLGFNVSYLFGTIEREGNVMFQPATQVPFNTISLENIFISDFMLDFGFQYVQPVNENWNLTLGGTYSLQNQLKGTREYLAGSYVISGLNEIMLDTVLFESGRGTMTLPQFFGAGFSLEGKRWLFALDWKRGDWSGFRSFGRSDSLVTSDHIRAGIQYVPDRTAAGNYFRLIQYRTGFRFSNTPLRVNNQQIQELGITIGAGLPLRRTRSAVNVGIEVGQRGTTEHNLIRERFINFSFGMAINDRWFIKRRFD
jgi:hypothetical protein